VNKSGPIAPTSIFARGQRRPPAGPEGAGASGKALGEVALLSPDETLQRLPSAASGLTPDQVEQQLRLVGRNEVAHQARHTILGELVSRSINPLNLLLLSLATASYFLGDQRAAIVIAVMVGLSIALGFIQEHRSNKAAEALQRMVLITAAVRRQAPGAAQDHVEVPIEQLVPGDIVLLSAGDMIPADMRVISANDLFINQSTLTGEAMPIEKIAAAHVGTAETRFDLPNICFMGSTVVSGVGCGVVVLTGARTAFGQVAGTIAEQRVLTSFDKGITRFTWLMIGFIVVMAPLVFVINGVTKGNWLEALLFAVAVAVGLTPEMLPMIVTVNLAKGAMAMSRKKVIVKRLNAIQNFGAMDVLCTDKTGTLTQDLIILKRHLDIRGGDSDSVLEYAYLNSFYQSGLKNLLDVAVLQHGELEGGLKLQSAGKHLPLNHLMVKTKRTPLFAKVGGGQLKIASASKLSFARQGFGSRFTAQKLKLTAKLAERLNKRLDLKGTFSEGQPLGTLISRTDPATATVLAANKATLVLDPETLAKLNALFVSVNPIFPAEHTGSTFSFPIVVGGAIAPNASAGTLRTGGDLELLQLGGGQIFQHEFWLDLGAKSDSAEVNVQPSPPYPGKQGRIGVLDLGAATVSSDPRARTITVSGAPLTLQAQTAARFDEAFAAGKEVFRAGEAFGTLSFTAQGQ